MFVQKVPHIKDQFLTQERASMELESGQIAVGWYTNEQDSQSVVHSHPYYELVLPLVGSNVRYSVDGNIYDINPGGNDHLPCPVLSCGHVQYHG